MAIDVEHPQLGRGFRLDAQGQDWLVRFSDGDYWVERATLSIPGQKIRDFERVEVLGPYHPYRAGNNPCFGGEDQRILDLKENVVGAAEYQANRLRGVLPLGHPVVAVPSHDPTSKVGGVRRVALILAASDWSDATDCIVRTRWIEKLARGGNRSLATQKSSLRIDRLDKISGRYVILLGDVWTTGNSLLAAYELLQAGASAVKRVALARTVS